MIVANTEKIGCQTNMLKTILIWTALSSCVTAGLYVWDKRMAVHERGRISERTLLLWCLLGGWPGAWITGNRIRHKTRKQSYRIRFGICVVINLVAAIGIFWLGN
ncbi:MAG: DUF1294 domain-containing protein [Rubripirellula sp.]|nr:cold-shock protein [Rhodopirellula sp.]MCH1438581.1 DUF1294 domain-containing protein [Rubripirellula sp.]OUX05902.1 MAG: hypothetical protein CBE00_08715 [Planctomycetaceae bacterium TMED240]